MTIFVNLKNEINMKPLKPKHFTQPINDVMIQTVNDLIKEKLHGGVALFSRQEIIDNYILNSTEKGQRDFNKAQEIEKSLYDTHQFDFENLFINAGWKVKSKKGEYEFRMKKKHLKAVQKIEKRKAKVLEPVE